MRLAAAAQLSIQPDRHRLADDLRSVTTHRWGLLRNQTDTGEIGSEASIDWRVLSLRSPGGDAARTDPGNPGPVDFADTVWRSKMPYLSALLADIPAPLNSVRLMALGPGAVAEPHCDPKYRLEIGFVRLHIPIVTNPEAVLVLDGVEHRWQPGTLWYGNFSRTHHVRNMGSSTRVHVVVDALLTESLAAWFPPDWQDELINGDTLLNHQTVPSPPQPGVLPVSASLPAGFIDFNSEDMLAGPPRQVRFSDNGKSVVMTTLEREFALTPVSEREYRFAGWSEQRTVAFDHHCVHLMARRSRSTSHHVVPFDGSRDESGTSDDQEFDSHRTDSARGGRIGNT